MKGVILIFIIAIIAMLPVCFVSVGMTGWSNVLAYRVMESIPNSGKYAQGIKADINEWLDNHPKKTYDDSYVGGCNATWSQLFRLQFCEHDFSGYDLLDDNGEGYCSVNNCPVAMRNLNCNDYELQFKQYYAKTLGLDPTDPDVIAKMPTSCEAGQKDSKYAPVIDCMDGAIIDCNRNGVADAGDIVHMSTCHHAHDARLGGGNCECSYALPEVNGSTVVSYGHAQIDLHCGDSGEAQSIFAPMSGLVVFSALTTTGWGHEIVVYNCGTLTHFNHIHYFEQMKHPDVEVGDWVNVGDTIGKMGGGVNGNDPTINGNSSGTHLDFGVMYCNESGSSTPVDIGRQSFRNPNWEGSDIMPDEVCDEFYGGRGRVTGFGLCE